MTDEAIELNWALGPRVEIAQELGWWGAMQTWAREWPCTWRTEGNGALGKEDKCVLVLD